MRLVLRAGIYLKYLNPIIMSILTNKELAIQYATTDGFESDPKVIASLEDMIANIREQIPDYFENDEYPIPDETE